MKQVEEEYYKTDEKTAHLPNAQAHQTGSPIELYPNSPEKPLSTIKQSIPEPVQQAVNDMIKSQKILGPLMESSTDKEESKNTIQYPTYSYKLEPSSIKNQTPY